MFLKWLAPFKRGQKNTQKNGFVYENPSRGSRDTVVAHEVKFCDQRLFRTVHTYKLLLFKA